MEKRSGIELLMSDLRNKQIAEMEEDLRGRDSCKRLPRELCNKRSCSLCEAEILYEAGYRKQEWISVDERLPDNSMNRVLVFLMDANFTKPIGENKIDTDRFIDGKWVRWSNYVTHWMPLPEPPKMKGGEHG